MALAGVAPGARVLDAPCGFGRHSIPLADAGYDMVGVDLSADQLREARARAGSRDNPALVEGDLRQLPFADAEFDCALNLFSSIGYWGDEGDLAVLRELWRVLRPDAALVIETMHRDRLVWILRERDWEHLPDGAVFLEERRFDLATGDHRGDAYRSSVRARPPGAGTTVSGSTRRPSSCACSSRPASGGSSASAASPRSP